ncbi:uncharacterized protein E0L32_004019 [Thyridium curvatum]|uniref:Cyclic nucleotide-binding domain-containing protein n=1 Tax=Thyridium curvatum TaxID=1093900 RepID=A0A507BIF5_9PEZI|nr:uncharacterized protein E0L32_004019 [Thyridium curvatum]TPX16370.1 hypothetical protein E0L32_004019 [Thyridium curvatum]
MRRSRVPSSPSSPYRALAHHHASGGGQQAPESVSSLIRSFNGETNPTRPMRPSPLTASTIADMPLELVDRIRSFPLFMSAPDEFLAAIGKHLRIQVHSAHDHILNEGDDARAMYWLVRGFVAVTSRDGEAVYAELKPGAFFGEIGVLMDVPRTATIIARSKCMLAVLKKEDLQAELPNFPDMEKAIRQEAQERLTILKKKQQERGSSFGKAVDSTSAKAREAAPGQVSTGEVGTISDGAVIKSKKRKSPSPGIIEDPAVGGSALTSGYFNVRKTLKELPLFSTLPTDILHFLGLSAQLKTYPPFTDIVQQGSSGQEIYFIVRGEAEVIHEEPEELSPTRTTSPSGIRPRLMQGQYFGEVASLGLSQGRTATVRSITTVECLMIGGDALDELWRRCPPDLRQQVEQTAKTRYQKSDDGDLEMEDVGHRESTADAQRPATPQRRLSLPQVVFTTPSKPASPANDESETRQPSDPDPFLSVDMENLRNRRRNSLAPPTPQSEPSSPPSSIHGSRVNSIDSSPLKFFTFPPPTPTEDEAGPYKKARILPSRPRTATSEIPQLTDEVLVGIFQQLNFMELIRMRAVSRHWRQLLSESPKLCTHVDLSPFNRQISDWALVNIVAPFIGTRPVEIDISNCFHVSDEGFQALWKRCGQNVKVWRMKSVWEVSATQILDMSENAKGLEEIDWSNCRKLGGQEERQGSEKAGLDVADDDDDGGGSGPGQRRRVPQPEAAQPLVLQAHHGPVDGAPGGARVAAADVAVADALHVHHGRRVPGLGAAPLLAAAETVPRRLHVPVGQRRRGARQRGQEPDAPGPELLLRAVGHGDRGRRAGPAAAPGAAARVLRERGQRRQPRLRGAASPRAEGPERPRLRAGHGRGRRERARGVRAARVA